MSKYESKAKEILARVQTLTEAFEIRKGNSGWPDYYVAPKDITGQFSDIVLDVQMLFFSDSPQLPLYFQAMKLNDRVDLVQSRCGDQFNYSDFTNIKELLSKYLEYREFLEAGD
ncbi:MAG: hypothetical protein JFR41_10860 [Muribaculaceae bacterium]|nr:hypothetical protein [Muribaculaceae bacterium]